MVAIHKVHGFQPEGYTLGLLLKVDFDLLFSYSFRDGYRFMFGDSVFPEWVKELETKKKIIVYATMILEAYGWVVTFTEDQEWYYLDFAPLQALTPEEVSREREQIAFRIAANALQVINQGLIEGKTFFTLEELAISESDSRLFTACLTRLRQLMPSILCQDSFSPPPPLARGGFLCSIF